MSDATCPSCGAEVPRETGQHAAAPAAGVVTCPSCGSRVTLQKPGADPAAGHGEGEAARAAGPGWGQATGEDSFAGRESVEGVMDELSEKGEEPA